MTKTKCATCKLPRSPWNFRPGTDTCFVCNPITFFRRKYDYKDYIVSDRWKAKRQQALEHYGNSCCLCGDRKRLEVHHRRYDNLGYEPMEDLAVLCNWHHGMYHDWEKAERVYG